MAITSAAELRALYGETAPRAARKVLDRLDGHCRQFIRHSPFVLIATSDGQTVDVSPKGDPAGSVVVEDDRHLLLADRPGNKRIDGLLNILRNPRIATLFLIPGVRETLRVNGTATIHDEPEWLDRCRIKGRPPVTVTRVRVEQVFLHCAKALLRSSLWDPASWPESRPVPVMGEMLRDHCGDDAAPESEAAMLARYTEALY
ncbi:MAG TPA: pyridoxamine 5'-phosphate oxidase family protein [Paracoccaceae bacterium]|nr:pyridoxamine 5'-phosphate oxidase family protein [Paracoccaceae bacterium]